MSRKHTATLDGVQQEARPERPLVVAVQVVAIANPKYITVPLIETYAVLDLRNYPFPTFNTSIDDVCDNTKTGKPPC